MYQARSLPDSPQEWAVLVAFVIVYVALQQILPEKFKTGWRKYAVNGALAAVFIAALFATHA